MKSRLRQTSNKDHGFKGYEKNKISGLKTLIWNVDVEAFFTVKT